jgi:hypothetical protein
MQFIKTLSIPEAYVKALHALKEEKGNLIENLIVEIVKPLQETYSLTEKSNVILEYEEFLTFDQFKNFHEEYKKLELKK